LYFKDKITLKPKAWGGSCGTLVKRQRGTKAADRFLNVFYEKIYLEMKRLMCQAGL